MQSMRVHSCAVALSRMSGVIRRPPCMQTAGEGRRKGGAAYVSMSLVACDFAPRSGAERSVTKREKRCRLLCGGESQVMVCGAAFVWHLTRCLLDGVLRQSRCLL